MKKAESAAPRRGMAVDEGSRNSRDRAPGTVPARHAQLDLSLTSGLAIPSSRRHGVSAAAVAIAALAAASLTAFASGPPRIEAAVPPPSWASSQSAATTTALPARQTDQVDRSNRRAPLIGSSEVARTSATASSTSPAPSPTRAKVKVTQPTKKPSAASQPGYPRALWRVTGTRFATTGLNLRTIPVAGSPVVTVVGAGQALKVTDATFGSFRQVSWNGRPVWVSKAHLASSKPVVTSSSTSDRSATPTGSCSKQMPAGVTAAARTVAWEACARFPAISSFGGYRAGDSGAHGSGRAVDMMISGDPGWQVAFWARANAGRLGITEVIYAQKIWTAQRSSDGWRPMSDRGGTTANHYDHVHVTVG
ncbi:SH3 domain-containing protein [Aestuariimicrobium kwangyangense]|uniref:SH3 domain-containing protein n=1 Tax=Aestuariimicrobium kwangyangense TaxID=396389 RepID=UPI0012F805EA|nr:SH3 domain-containing protein [Aestuariimicrobium kwangyangense]